MLLFRETIEVFRKKKDYLIVLLSHNKLETSLEKEVIQRYKFYSRRLFLIINSSNRGKTVCSLFAYNDLKVITLPLIEAS